MKVLEIMVNKTQFEMEIPARETRYKEEVKAPDPSSSERNFVVTSNYHLTHDKITSEIKPSQGYNYVDFSYYDLNVDEGL